MSTIYVSGNGTGKYNCDGSDDHVQIQQALVEAAKTAGTTVYLKGPFTYNVQPNKMYVGSNTTVTGDSTAIVKLYKQDRNFPTPSLTRAMFQAASSSTANITFHGFTIDGNIENSWSVSGNDHVNMIQLLGSSNVTVYDMFFKNGLGDAVKVRQGGTDNYCHENTNISIYNNKIDKVGHEGIYLFCVSKISIHDNWISCRDDSGIRLFNCKNADIFNNEITSENHGGAGIEIQKNSEVPINNINIHDNKIWNIRTMGIWVYGYKSYPLSAATGVHIYRNSIRGNGLYSGTVGGICVQGFHETLIENNVLDGNFRYGIASFFPYSSTASSGSGYVTYVKNNEIYNTHADKSSSGTGWGIANEVPSSHKIVSSGNYLYGNKAGNYKNVSSSGDFNTKKPETATPPVITYKEGDNRLKEYTPDTVLSSSPYIDVGGMSTGRYRGVMWFDLSKYTSKVGKAILSLYWYYPEGATRTADTIIEIYRPAPWHYAYTSWNKKNKDVSWNNKGGDWYDKNGTAQGSSPYASMTFKGSSVPDNKYYDLDVTQLVNEYLTKKWDNTGFLIKAKTETDNYIAFYSLEGTNKPTLKIDENVIENIVCPSCKNQYFSIVKINNVLKIVCGKCGVEYEGV